MTEEKRRATWRSWTVGVLSGLIALAALVVGSAFGDISKKALNPRLIGWICAAALMVFGAVAVTRISKLLARHVSATSVPTAGGAVRIISAGIGYLIVVFGVLGELKVPIEHLLVGAGLAGIVLGIAAQQTLGNVFAGLVLIFAKPFRIGDRIRIRSGALGGIFDARVREMSLTYVTLRSDDGEWKIPNSAMLSAGVLLTPHTPLPPPATPVPAPGIPTQANAPSSPGARAAAGGRAAGGQATGGGDVAATDGEAAGGAAGDGAERVSGDAGGAAGSPSAPA